MSTESEIPSSRLSNDAADNATGEAVAPAEPDGGELEGLELLLTHPLEALKRLKMGVTIGAGGLVYVAAQLVLGNADGWLLSWATWAGIVFYGSLSSGTWGVFGPRAEEGEFVLTGRRAVRPWIRVLSGLMSVFMLFGLYAMLTMGTALDAEAWVAFCFSLVMVIAMLALAITGGGYAREPLPPVPHPAYLGAATAPSALGEGDSSAVPDLPLREPEPAPVRRDS